MGFKRLFRRLTRRGVTPAAPATPLKYSDYLAGAAIVGGVVAASTFVLQHDPDLASEIGLFDTAAVALSQWLQSKGD